MKRVLSIFLALLLLVFVYINAEAKEEPVQVELPQIIDTLTYPDYSVLYTCRQDKNTDSCLYITLPEADLLMRIARTEGGPTLDGQLWTMRVIYNRLSNGNFGNSIWDIISSTGQFEVFTTGQYIKADVNINSHIALAMIESGWNETQGALYWRTETGSTNSWHERKLQYIATIDGNRYYK